MSKKRLLVIILVFTVLTIIFFLKPNTKYNKLIITQDKWNSIIENRNINPNLNLDISFNDYNLLIDEESSIVYYSIVDVKNKYNPSITYSNNLKVGVNKALSEENNLKILVYNDKEYKIYSLVVTNYPLLNVSYRDEKNAEVYIFDNDKGSINRVVKSDGKFKKIEDSKYILSLKEQSLGNNKRDNYVSILGMSKQNEYVIEKGSENGNILLFINNKYQGTYSLKPNEERRINNYEQNKENNK